MGCARSSAVLPFEYELKKNNKSSSNAFIDVPSGSAFAFAAPVAPLPVPAASLVHTPSPTPRRPRLFINTGDNDEGDSAKKFADAANDVETTEEKDAKLGTANTKKTLKRYNLIDKNQINQIHRFAHAECLKSIARLTAAHQGRGKDEETCHLQRLQTQCPAQDTAPDPDQSQDQKQHQDKGPDRVRKEYEQAEERKRIIEHLANDLKKESKILGPTPGHMSGPRCDSETLSSDCTYIYAKSALQNEATSKFDVVHDKALHNRTISPCYEGRTDSLDQNAVFWDQLSKLKYPPAPAPAPAPVYVPAPAAYNIDPGANLRSFLPATNCSRGLEMAKNEATTMSPAPRLPLVGSLHCYDPRIATAPTRSLAKGDTSPITSVTATAATSEDIKIKQTAWLSNSYNFGGDYANGRQAPIPRTKYCLKHLEDDGIACAKAPEINLSYLLVGNPPKSLNDLLIPATLVTPAAILDACSVNGVEAVALSLTVEVAVPSGLVAKSEAVMSTATGAGAGAGAGAGNETDRTLSFATPSSVTDANGSSTMFHTLRQCPSAISNTDGVLLVSPVSSIESRVINYLLN